MTGSIVIDGENFVAVRYIYQPRALYFRAGRKIAVEKFAVFQGSHEFIYEVNSRSVDISGVPISIATNQKALKNEFFELTMVNRSPVPIVFGRDTNGEFNVKIQPNDIRPQIFETKESGEHIAWSIIVESISYNGTMSTLGAAKTMSTRVKQRSGSSPAQREKMHAGAKGDYDNAERDAASSTTGDPTHMIKIYIQEKNLSIYRNYPEGFGTRDIIGTDPSLKDRLRDLFR